MLMTDERPLALLLVDYPRRPWTTGIDAYERESVREEIRVREAIATSKRNSARWVRVRVCIFKGALI